VHFYAGQNSPPPLPDHRFGYYPLKDADKRLAQRYGGDWETLKSALNQGALANVAAVLGIVEDLNPYNPRSRGYGSV
jgi:hypothetical protein